MRTLIKVVTYYVLNIIKACVSMLTSAIKVFLCEIIDGS